MKNNIKKLRINSGLSQEVLGDKVGATKATIQKLENDRMRLTTIWIEKISKALNCSPSALIQDTTQPKEMSGAEVAIIYVLKEIISMMIHQKRPTRKNFINDLGYALEHYREQNLSSAVSVMGDLLAHVKAESHQEEQQVIQRLLQLSPPK